MELMEAIPWSRDIHKSQHHSTQGALILSVNKIGIVLAIHPNFLIKSDIECKTKHNKLSDRRRIMF